MLWGIKSKTKIISWLRSVHKVSSDPGSERYGFFSINSFAFWLQDLFLKIPEINYFFFMAIIQLICHTISFSRLWGQKRPPPKNTKKKPNNQQLGMKNFISVEGFLFSSRYTHLIINTSLWFHRELIFCSGYSWMFCSIPWVYHVNCVLIVILLFSITALCVASLPVCTSLYTVVGFGASYNPSHSVWWLQCHLKLWAKWNSYC